MASKRNIFKALSTITALSAGVSVLVPLTACSRTAPADGRVQGQMSANDLETNGITSFTGTGKNISVSYTDNTDPDAPITVDVPGT
jgi:hypothetical protein